MVGDKVPVAIAVRGASGHSLAHARALCSLADENGVIEMIDALRSYQLNLSVRRHFQNDEKAGFDFAVAVWHPTEGPQQFRIHSYPTLPDFAPFELHSVEFLLACGSYFDSQALFDRGILPVRGDGHIWAKTKGAEIMDLMRATKADNLPGYEGEPFYAIGGHVDLASVTAEGASIERVRVWKDRIGRKIKPEVEEPAANVAGLNRQMRRAMRRRTA
ncbi:hypothetical protein [Pararhizobium gei]|uniref:hypothetical protein n=1 Tax=Pararhizobium gei TaxID=1395951 RepID=UPI0023DCBDAB|nr:hypothetical protein [Rhizobium gei]